MQKIIIALFLLKLLGGDLYAISNEKDSLFLKIQALSGKYLNCSYFTENDSTLKICEKAIGLATALNNHIEQFKAEQLAINIYCLKGNIAQGIDMAKKMYQDAKTLNNPLDKALALQAMGATYMYAHQYQQALAIFSEASPVIFSEGDTLLKANLLVQQIHVYLQLGDTTKLATHLCELQQLVTPLPSELKDIYLFYVTCYETLLQITAHQPAEAEKSLQKLSSILPEDISLNIWRYSLKAGVCQMIEENKQALIYYDSTQLLLSRTGNPNDYRSLLYNKAALLEKNGDLDEACSIYSLADSLTNILDMEHYSKQIENLHLTYYVDQVAIENAQMRNELLTKILIYSIIGILIAAILIIIARKRNRQLILSRERLSRTRQITADSIQSKSIFLSNMSHDLRTPLNAIVGFSEILTTTEDIDSSMKQQCRDYIKQNSDLLMKLMNDIIDFSTLKDAKIKFDFGKYDAVALCRNVVETIANIKQTEAEISFFTTVEKLEIETDSERLQQVLINLLTNATKFTKMGHIHLHLDYIPGNNKVTFIVEDTGCGIPPEKQARIFERFEKLHESVQGVGLGLSICKLIIDHINGDIRIDSTYTQGARFIFTHPVIHTSKQEQ